MIWEKRLIDLGVSRSYPGDMWAIDIIWITHEGKKSEKFLFITNLVSFYIWILRTPKTRDMLYFTKINQTHFSVCECICTHTNTHIHSSDIFFKHKKTSVRLRKLKNLWEKNMMNCLICFSKEKSAILRPWISINRRQRGRT